MTAQNQKLIDALNADIADELAAVIQYMWHHVMAQGFDTPAIEQKFSQTAMDEMKHAERLAERVDYLGGVPTTRVGEIKVGGDLRKMMEDDLAGELKAIATYKEHIKLAVELGDPVTRLMLEEILSDEEGHEHTWRTILEK